MPRVVRVKVDDHGIGRGFECRQMFSQVSANQAEPFIRFNQIALVNSDIVEVATTN